MTIASKLQLTLDTKQAIKQALIDKGAEPSDVFSTYPGLIEDLAGEGVATPVIISPLNGATGVSPASLITGSAYAGIADGALDPHQDSLWEFASDAEFTDIIHSSGWTSQHLESYELPSAGPLVTGSAVYARVTYRAAGGEVATSAPISFAVTVASIGAVIEGDIVYAQLGGDWLLAAPATKRGQRRWGLRGTDVSALPNNPIPDPHTGTFNTHVLTSAAYSSIDDGYGSIGAPAATFCRDMGYDLPNREELNLMYQNQGLIDSADTSGGSNTLTSFGTTNVWTSTQYTVSGACIQRFSDGFQGGTAKNGEYWVVPVRRIPV